MTCYPNLAKAPITEAVIDIWANAPADVREVSFAEFKDLLRDEYPFFETRGVIEATVNVKNESEEMKFSQALKDKGFQSLWLRSKDKLNIAQFRLDGFAVNRLRPYEGWSKLRDEAQKLWAIFVKNIRPRSVTRIAVRYINHLHGIPGPVESFTELNDYLVCVPVVPPEHPQLPVTFYSRTVTRDPNEIQVNFIQTLETPAIETPRRPLTAIIDIDAYRQFDSIDPEDDKIWSILEEIREVKNRVFFASLTEKMVNKLK